MNDAQLAACTASLVRYRPMFESFTRPATEYLCARLPSSALHVLDLASGIGDPALAIAARLPAPCTLTALDLQRALLSALRREAEARHLTNVRVHAADMQALPYANRTFDCVVSRLGLQQVADPRLALREARRVLRQGGRALYLVWGRPDQPLLRHTVLEPLARCGGPRFRVGEPGPFRFAAQDVLARAARDQGFSVLEAEAYEATWSWPGSAETLWQATRETSAPLFEPLFTRLSSREQAELEQGVLTKLRPFEHDVCTKLPVSMRALVVEKI